MLTGVSTLSVQTLGAVGYSDDSREAQRPGGKVVPGAEPLFSGVS